MEENNILFSSIIFLPVLNFSLHFETTASKPLILYELVKPSEKKMKRKDKKKNVNYIILFITTIFNTRTTISRVRKCYGTVRIVSSNSIRNTINNKLTYSVMNQNVA